MMNIVMPKRLAAAASGRARDPGQLQSQNFVRLVKFWLRTRGLLAGRAGLPRLAEFTQARWCKTQGLPVAPPALFSAGGTTGSLFKSGWRRLPDRCWL